MLLAGEVGGDRLEMLLLVLWAGWEGAVGQQTGWR